MWTLAATGLVLVIASHSHATIGSWSQLQSAAPAGVREGHSRTLTSFWRGNYETDPQLRTEFLQAVNHLSH